MEEDFYKKYDYFSLGILNENPKAFSTLGYLIDNKILDDIKIQDKISSIIFKACALKGIPIALSNYALCLKNGRGVKQDDD